MAPASMIQVIVSPSVCTSASPLLTKVNGSTPRRATWPPIPHTTHPPRFKVLPGFANILGILPTLTAACLARMRTMPQPPWLLLSLLLPLLLEILQLLPTALVLALPLPTPTPTGILPKHALGSPVSVSLAGLFPSPRPTRQTPPDLQGTVRGLRSHPRISHAKGIWSPDSYPRAKVQFPTGWG